MKRVLLVLSGIAVLAVFGVAAMRLDAQSIRDQVAEAVRGATGKPLIIQDIPQVSFMPPGVKFGAAYWGVSPDGKLDPAGGIAAAVKSGQISVQFLPLLSGKVLIDEVRLDSPDVSIRLEKGPRAAAPKALGAKATREPPIPPQVEVNRLSVTNASILLEIHPGQSLRLSKLNLELDNLKVGAEMRLDISANLAMNGPALEGALTLKAKARLQKQSCELRDCALRFTPDKGIAPAAPGPVDLALQAHYELDSGKLNLTLFSLSALGSRLEIAGDADIATSAFNGRCKVDGVPRKLAPALGLNLPFDQGPASFKLQSSLAMSGKTLSLGSIQGKLDATGIDGNLSLELSRMHVSGALNLGALNLDALMASAPLPPYRPAEAPAALISPAEALAATSQKAPPAVPKAPAQPAASAAQNAPPATASSDLPSVDLELTCASLTLAKLQFKDIRAKVRGRGLYRIEPLSLILGTGGTVQLNLGVDASAMRYTAAGKVSNVAVGPLLQALQDKRPVDGAANLDLDNISCTGTDPKAVRASLSGKGLLTARGIVLNGASILPKDAPAGLGNPPAHFEQLTAHFTASGGMVTVAPVTLTSPSAGVKGQGVVRLPQENMDFTADVSLLKIAAVPVRVSGPFSSLSYGVDGKRALRMLTQTPAALGEAAGIKAEETARDEKNLFKGIGR